MSASNVLEIIPNPGYSRTADMLLVELRQTTGFTATFLVRQGSLTCAMNINASFVQTLPQKDDSPPQMLIDGTSTVRGVTYRTTAVYAPQSLGGSGSGFVITQETELLDTKKALALFGIIGRMTSTYITNRVPSIDQKMCDLHAEAQQVFLADNPDKLDGLRKNGPR